ncbi:two-component regulator propeller domain-containing protein [Sphingobacterium sp. SGR-19]|uniref:ligand-binding sensor domain-containing protein n=1 Tax=Sphingobacterium sp. SGR-19 TaxID=2710886 RepID=UPI0013EB4417|nr:sensor histidine kinase [Sphingobacterium sp. SGR-19]NGM66554.1 hybrid sensor histidine kinase/response regulator [Sphingobacterium sp. SGR-19]
MSAKCWLFLSLFFVHTFLKGAVSPYYFNHFQVNRGLSNNAILCSVQDQDGFIWFGTRDGLNRFDGYRFKNFFHESENENSLGSNLIHSLMVRKTNEIWVGTDQGIYIYDPQQEEFSLFDKIKKSETLQIDEDPGGNIWFISNSRLYKYNPTTEQIDETYAKQRKEPTHAFCIDKQGEVWIGLKESICHVNSGKEYKFSNDKQFTGGVEELFVDDNNDMWIGTSHHGVYKWNRKDNKTQHVIKKMGNKPLYVREIEQISKDQLWIGTESGLLVHEISKNKTIHIIHEKDNPWSLSDNAVYSVMKDNRDGIWIGTFFGGINYYHPQHNLFEKIFPRNSPNAIGGHAVREIVEDDQHNIWIGTEDQGLSFWDQKTNQFRNFGPENGLAHTNIHGLLITGDSLLIGTFFQGLDVIDIRKKKVIKHFDSNNTDQALKSNFIYHIYKTSKGDILLATAPGIFQFIPGEDQFIRFKGAPGHVFFTSIFEDKNQTLWFTTWRDGLYMLPHGEQKPTRYVHDPKDPFSISSNRVNRVFQDSKGQIWVATESGLCIYDKSNQSFKRFTSKDGLPSNLILAMLEDNSENLWISTTRGLVKMNIRSHRIEKYSLEHGLLDLQFNYNSAFKDTNGLLYFGASKGLIRFDPSSITDLYKTDFDTPIYITGIQSNQQELTIQDKKGALSKSILYTDEIKLPYDESTISFDFVALNFASANATSYLYRLVGLDTTWTFLRNNTKANFTKIPPGKYTFEVMASDANKTPISKIKSLKITILPPFWASVPAYIIYVLFSVGLIGMMLYWYDHKMKEKNRRRLEKIKAYKEKELYKAKMDFFMQITHDIKTPLTLIKAPLEKIMLGAEPKKSGKWLKTIHQNTEKLLSMTDNLLDFRKVESNEFSLKLKKQSVSSLILICLQDFAPLIESKKIKVSKSLDRKLEANIDIEAMYKILSNLLSNAFKYAEKHVFVNLYKIADSECFCIEIKNDGILLSDEEKTQIFEPFQRASTHYRVKGSGLGLALAYSFVSLHGGTLAYKKNSENLNIFVLEIPL